MEDTDITCIEYDYNFEKIKRSFSYKYISYYLALSLLYVGISMMFSYIILIILNYDLSIQLWSKLVQFKLLIGVIILMICNTNYHVCEKYHVIHFGMITMYIFFQFILFIINALIFISSINILILTIDIFIFIIMNTYLFSALYLKTYSKLGCCNSIIEFLV